MRTWLSILDFLLLGFRNRGVQHIFHFGVRCSLLGHFLNSVLLILNDIVS